MKGPIFILGAHKSGTSLLRSLLDGHPALFVAPVETHFFVHAGRWIDYPYRRSRPRRVDGATFIESVKAWIRLCNVSEDPQADSVARHVFDLARFDETLAAEAPSDDGPREAPAAWWRAYMSALHASVHGSALAVGKRVVEKSVENAECAPDLQAMFPDATFIHIVRNPYANLVSIRKYRSLGGRYPLLWRAHEAIHNSWYHLYRNRSQLARHKVVRYEDLVTEPERTIRGLCDFARLEFAPILLQPTFLGRPWDGNSTGAVTFHGVSAERVDAWKTEITPVEVALVNRTFHHVLEEFGYESFSSRRSPLLPARWEGPLRYIANRVLWCSCRP